MRFRITSLAVLLLLAACASDTYYDPLIAYEELDAATILDAPTPVEIAPENIETVTRGEYLVEILGCGVCHTDGALIGEPNSDMSLAGSRIGIAYTSPLENRYPGVVYAPNITPDDETGIGRWSDRQIGEAVRVGLGRHGERRILVMPWQGYAQISDDDAYAIVGYLRNIKPVKHWVPEGVLPGTMAGSPYVHFGVYRSRGLISE
jgi:hypothetical protein